MFGQQGGLDTMWRVMTYVLATAAGIKTLLVLLVMSAPLISAGDDPAGWYRPHYGETHYGVPGETQFWNIEHREGYTVSEDSHYMRELAKRPYWVPAAKPSEQYPYRPIILHYHYDAHSNRRPCYGRH